MSRQQDETRKELEELLSRRPFPPDIDDVRSRSDQSGLSRMDAKQQLQKEYQDTMNEWVTDCLIFLLRWIPL